MPEASDATQQVRQSTDLVITPIKRALEGDARNEALSLRAEEFENIMVDEQSKANREALASSVLSDKYLSAAAAKSARRTLEAKLAVKGRQGDAEARRAEQAFQFEQAWGDKAAKFQMDELKEKLEFSKGTLYGQYASSIAAMERSHGAQKAGFMFNVLSKLADFGYKTYTQHKASQEAMKVTKAQSDYMNNLEDQLHKINSKYEGREKLEYINSPSFKAFLNAEQAKFMNATKDLRYIDQSVVQGKNLAITSRWFRRARGSALLSAQKQSRMEVMQAGNELQSYAIANYTDVDGIRAKLQDEKDKHSQSADGITSPQLFSFFDRQVNTGIAAGIITGPEPEHVRKATAREYLKDDEFTKSVKKTALSQLRKFAYKKKSPEKVSYNPMVTSALGLLRSGRFTSDRHLLKEPSMQPFANALYNTAKNTVASGGGFTEEGVKAVFNNCLLYTSPSPRD